MKKNLDALSAATATDCNNWLLEKIYFSMSHRLPLPVNAELNLKQNETETEMAIFRTNAIQQPI